MADYLGKDTFKLGFGLMRLPKNADGSIDIPQTTQMADAFLAAGGTYFDTAFVYDKGGSEEAVRKVLTERIPRDRYTLATKLHAGMHGNDEETVKEEFRISLARTGAGYFDYYLLHAIQRSNVQKYDEYHLWDYVRSLKEQGLIRHWGFSFHADPELLEMLLDAHPDTEFVQLQLNYADWENPGVAAHRNWEICSERGIPVTVMEPVKGGILADPIPTVRAVFDRTGRNLSYAGWALRYAASLDNVITVLSGMSSLSQMEDNLRTMRDFSPMNEEEQAVIREAQKALSEDRAIPCTACHYCTGGCPMEIPIPEIFHVSNHKEGSPRFRTVREYNIVTQGKGRAGDCIACGQCEAVCPQHLPVIDLLRQMREWEE